MKARISPIQLLVSCAVLLACGMVSGTPLRAQSSPSSSSAHQPQAQAPETIRSNVRRVIVDVVVTDSAGKPVGGLSARDFSVYEDGQAQRILSFESHSGTTDAEFVPPRLPALPANWYVDLPPGPERGPLYVVLLDLLHTDINDQPRVRKQLQEFLAAKPEGARFAIFALTDTLHLVQGFTADRKRLLAAVAPRSSPLPYIFLDASNFREYVSGTGALIDIARFLTGLPGRKNLIWIAGDFPYYMLVRAGLGGPDAWALVNPLASSENKEATDALARAQVSVYPVDAQGLVVYRDQEALNSSHMFEDSIAEQTGGRAFYNSNGIVDFLDGVADTGENYYELTYSPPNQNDENKLRHIKVSLSRHGYHLAYRRSYFLGALDEPVPVASKRARELLALPGVIQPDDSLYVYMQHGAPTAHGLVFFAHVQRVGGLHRPTSAQLAALAQQPAYFRGVGKKPDWRLSSASLQTFAVGFRISAAQLERMAGHPGTGETTTLEFALAAFDKDGVMVNSAVEEAEATSTQKQALRVFTIDEQIDIPSGGAWLRCAIRDDSTGRIGAMEIRLPVRSEATRK